MPPTKRILRDQRIIDLWHPLGGNRSAIARELGLTRARVAQLVIELREQHPGCLADFTEIRAPLLLENQRQDAIKALEYLRDRYRRPLERALAMRADQLTAPEPSGETALRYQLLLRAWEYGPNSLKQGNPPPRPSVRHWCKMFLERDQRYAFLLEYATRTTDLTWLKRASQRPSHHSELTRMVSHVTRVGQSPSVTSPQASHRTESLARPARATSF